MATPSYNRICWECNSPPPSQLLQRRTPSVHLTQVSEWAEGVVRQVDDYLVGEEPLEVRTEGFSLGVTMRTPGHDVELAAGFLLTEGIIEDVAQLVSIGYAARSRPGERGNIIEVELREDVEIDRERAQRRFTAGSSCGICGRASIEAVRLRGLQPPNSKWRLDPEVLYGFPEKLRASQALFGRTGGLHAAALFKGYGELVVLREDVGRHNAVDKVVGWALLENRLPLSEYALMVSGRGGFELVQKAVVAGVPVMASVSAPSSLAVRLAREMRLTLIGFLRGMRFVVYAGEERLGASA